MTFAARTLGSSDSVELPASLMSASQESYLGDDGYSGFKIDSDGFIYRTQDTSLNWVLYQPSTFTTWLKSGSASDYSVRVTISGGSTSGGSGEAFNGATSDAAGSWLALSSDRLFYYGTTAQVLRGMAGTIELALTSATSNVLASTTIDIYLFVTAGSP